MSALNNYDVYVMGELWLSPNGYDLRKTFIQMAFSKSDNTLKKYCATENNTKSLCNYTLVMNELDEALIKIKYFQK
jgi:hypothetical protein